MRWIIADIHGMLRPLRTLLEMVRRADPAPRFIFSGDYVNRGPDSKGVVDLLLALEHATFLRGNHDDIFDQILHGTCYAENATRGDRLAAFAWFMKHGLDSTLVSYDVDITYMVHCAQHPTEQKLQRIVDWIPKAHRDFFRNLLPVHEEADLFVVHGKWDVDVNSEGPGIAEQLRQQPRLRHRTIWGRYVEEEISHRKPWGRTGYFGHTPVSFYTAAYPHGRNGHQPLMEPVTGPRIVLLDAAAALGEDGRLTAYCADDGTFLQSDHFGHPVSR